MQKKNCRICKNLNDGTQNLAVFNRMLAEEVMSIEALAKSISAHPLRRRYRGRDNKWKWVRYKPDRYVEYSTLDVEWHRDHCLRGVLQRKIEQLVSAELQLQAEPEPTIRRIDRLYDTNERVMNVLMRDIEKKLKSGTPLSDQDLKAANMFNSNMMKNSMFRSKITAEVKPDPNAPGKSGPSVNINTGLLLPTSYGKTPEEVRQVIEAGMLPASTPSGSK